MADLLSLAEDIEWPDHEASSMVRERFAHTSGYGRLAELAEWAAAVHPVGKAFARIRGAITAPPQHLDTAEAVSVTLAELEVGDDVRAAFDTAVQWVDTEVDSGTDLILLAAPGLTADAATAASVLTNTEPVKVLSRGAAATSPERWMELAIAVRDARRRCMSLRDRPDELLDAIGSTRLAVAAAICMRAAVRRTPVMLDGPAAAIGALVAYEAAPRAVRWWCTADLGPDPVHAIALTRLGQKPILGLETGLGDGLAGLLAVPVLQTAVRLSATDSDDG